MATSIADLKTKTVTKDELAIKKFMDACDRDPKLRAELFRAPKEVAAKHGVNLEPEEEMQLKRIGELMHVIDDFTAARIIGPGPIFYPADKWWKQALFDHVVNYEPLYNKLFPRPPFPGYPADLRLRQELELERMFGLTQKVR